MLSTKGFLMRFVRGFEESTRTTQAPFLPNHVVWTLGHCALTMNRMAERFDGQPLPDRDFVSGDGGNGTSTQFDTESVCIGSQPVDEPTLYPTLARGIEAYELACDRFAAALRNATDEQLETMVEWHDGTHALWTLVNRVIFHNGTHAGQLVDLRRALRMDRIIR